MKPSKDVHALLDIMAALRDKETGCPWDIKQSFKTIAPYTIEEAYEVAEAIEREDHIDLCDELGDLLLQVVFHSQMAQELELFGFGDVVESITQKLIRRHPHVFGQANAKEADDVKPIWEKIKAEERAEKKRKRSELGLPQAKEGILDKVPFNHPALILAFKLQKEAAKVGFDWSNRKDVLNKVIEEIGEFVEESESGKSEDNRAKIEEEFGDVLFSLVNLGRHLNINAEQALRKTSAKFKRRFEKVEEFAQQEGSPLEDLGLDRMEQAWEKAKLAENQ